MEKQIQNPTPTPNKLNDDWIKDFEEEDKKYGDFYKEDNYYVNLHFIYINEENSIEKIKQEKFFMNIPNYVMREEILYLLKKHTIMDDKKYSIFSLLRYNNIMEPNDIIKYIHSDSESQSNESSSFLTSIQNIDTIYFEKTIGMFQDLNELFFILHEKRNDKKVDRKDPTKKVFFHSKKNKKHTRKH